MQYESYHFHRAEQELKEKKMELEMTCSPNKGTRLL